MWMIKPLEGKYYGTKIVNWETDDIIEVWLPFKTYTHDEVSEREKELGWGEDGDFYFDHVESKYSYEAAQKIVKALNETR